MMILSHSRKSLSYHTFQFADCIPNLQSTAFALISFALTRQEIIVRFPSCIRKSVGFACNGLAYGWVHASALGGNAHVLTDLSV
jgi:hypothetical protein